MARTLAVEGETRALLADLDEPTIKGQILGRNRRLRLDQQRLGRFVGRLQWILRK
jgi:hypothetical protein